MLGSGIIEDHLVSKYRIIGTLRSFINLSISYKIPSISVALDRVQVKWILMKFPRRCLANYIISAHSGRSPQRRLLVTKNVLGR